MPPDALHTPGMAKPQAWNFRDHDVIRYDSRTEQPDALDAPHIGLLLEQLAEVRAEMAASRPAYEFTGPRTFGGVPSDSAPMATLANPFSSPCEVCILCVSNVNSVGANTIAVSNQSSLNPLAVAAIDQLTVLQGDMPFLYVTVTPLSATSVAPPLAWFPLAANEALYIYSAKTGGGVKGIYATVQFRRRVNPAGVPNQGYP